MPEFIFTFGSNHRALLEPYLGHRFCAIEADTEEAAREKMFAVRGPRWAFCYPSREAAGVDRHGLHQVALERLAPRPEFNVSCPSLHMHGNYVYAGENALTLPWETDAETAMRLARIVSACFELHRACSAFQDDRPLHEVAQMVREALAKADGAGTPCK